MRPAVPRRAASRRAQAVHNASERISTRNYSRRLVQVSSTAGFLETLARSQPHFYLRLAESVGRAEETVRHPAQAAD